MRSQFHAYCFSLSEDRKAIAIFFDQFKRQKICGFFSSSSIHRHAIASSSSAIYTTKPKKNTLIHQQVGQTTEQKKNKKNIVEKKAVLGNIFNRTSKLSFIYTLKFYGSSLLTFFFFCFEVIFKRISTHADKNESCNSFFPIELGESSKEKKN